MIDKYIEKILNKAFVEANEARFEFFTTEHMLLALCTHDAKTRQTLVELGADIVEIQTNLQDFLERNCPKLLNQEGTTPTSAFH
ncbi:MAG: Clp protease N-terminal domain-containing protein, partial [Ostreibacterium sp.]